MLRKNNLLLVLPFLRQSLYIFSFSLALFSSQFVYSQNKPPSTAPQLITLELNNPVEREFTNGFEKHSYQINLSVNQLAKLSIQQRDVSITARISAADGELIADIDTEPIGKGAEKIEFVAKIAGNYKLEIKPSLPKIFAGKYSINLSEVREATTAERQLDKARRQYYEALKFYNDSKAEQGIEVTLRSLEICERISGAESMETAASLKLLGMLYLTKNDLPPAETFLLRAGEIIFKSFGDNNLNYADVLHHLARIQFIKGNYQQTEKLNQQALSIRESISGKESLSAANSLFSLGLLYRTTNDIPRAEQMYLRVLAIREKMLGADHLEAANLQNNLGYLYYTVGDYETAEIFYRRSLEIKEENLGLDHLSVAFTVNNQGLLAWKKGNYQKAEDYWKRALAIAEKTSGAESDLIAVTLHNLGIVYKETGNFPKGEEYYGRALAMWEKIFGKDNARTGMAVSSLGILYRAQGDYARAEEFHLRELEIFEKIYGANHPETAISLNHLARLYTEKGDISRALEYQKRAIAIEEKNMALSLAIGSERQKIAFFTKNLQSLDRIISLHAQTAPQNREARNLAATMILGRKGRILDALAENLATLRRRSNPDDQALIDKLNEINSQLSQLLINRPQKTPLEDYQKQIKQLEHQKEQTESEIGRRSFGFFESTKPVTLEAVQDVVPPKSALIEFAVYRPYIKKEINNKDVFGEPRYIAYIIRQQSEISWTDLGEKKAIDAAVIDLRNGLRDSKINVRQIARTVDEKVMQPIRVLVGDSKKLFISPDGELNLIPFEALIDEKEKYLIENYSVNYLTSGRDLLRMKTARVSQNKPLIIANPDFGGEAPEQNSVIRAVSDLPKTYFAPLAATVKEARSIQNLFPEADYLNGGEASETSLKKSVAPRILHIATHGFFLQESKEISDKNTKRSSEMKSQTDNSLARSGLALAGANRRKSEENDGILTALEVSGLNLWGTKLVVLSACDTGLGEVNGEGVYGLRRAFALAGTESMVMSLWAVSDFVTRELMTDYYKNLKDGGGRGAALRQAQLEMLKKPSRRHPFYWAAFIHSGEWANLDGAR